MPQGWTSVVLSIYYIVRSDLNCYMKSSNFNKGDNLTIYSLHPSCRYGDHYLADESNLFYIIKGNSYRRVCNMNTDESAVVYRLHPECQGGDHYLSAFGHFYIIYQARGVYRKTSNINTYEGGIEYTLHPNCREGLYYFGINSHYYFVKPNDEGGSTYYKCTNFNKNLNGETLSFHPSVLNFLPGGLALTHGPSFGVWGCIRTIANESLTPVTSENKVVIKDGYEKETMTSIEANWNVSTPASVEAGALSSSLAKSQFSFSASYGGVSVNTEKENWSQVTERAEAITLTVQPNQKIYIWQYQLGLGKTSLLYCRDLQFTDDPNPPTANPLPPAK